MAHGGILYKVHAGVSGVANLFSGSVLRESPQRPSTTGSDTERFSTQSPHRSLADGAPAGAAAGSGLPVSGSIPRAFQYDSPYDA